MNPTKYKVGKITIAPQIDGLEIYREKRLILQLDKEDGLSLLSACLEFTRAMTNEDALKRMMKGKRKAKTSKHQ